MMWIWHVNLGFPLRMALMETWGVPTVTGPWQAAYVRPVITLTRRFR